MMMIRIFEFLYDTKLDKNSWNKLGYFISKIDLTISYVGVKVIT